MLKINANQDKELTFEVEIGGVSPDSISARLRLVLDEIEYGFPAKVTSQSIIVEMPALRKILHRKVKEGETIQARLDLTSDGNVVSPWSEVLEVTEFVVSEAKLMDDSVREKVNTLREKEEPSMDARDKARELTERAESKTRIDSDDSTDLESKIRKRLAENKGDKTEGKYSALSGADADVEMSSKIIDKLNEKLFGGKKTKREKQLENLSEKVDITVARRKAKSTFSPRRASNTKGITTEMIKNFTREDVLAYMSRAGTTNTRVQEILYEQAETAAKSDSPVKILKEVIKIIKKNKRG
jgi:hypothetical protein